jgi:hypothetical protein
MSRHASLLLNTSAAAKVTERLFGRTDILHASHLLDPPFFSSIGVSREPHYASTVPIPRGATMLAAFGH